MKKLFLLLLVLVSTGCDWDYKTEISQEDVSWAEYEGGFFDVKYPSSFEIYEEGDDYAAFVSPDEEVVFAVYSPLWFGDPEIIMPSGDETIVSEKTEENGVLESELGPDSTQKIVWITVEANDESYTRSIIDMQLIGPSDDKTRKTFSFQYKDQIAYDKYEMEYARFKESLIQYSD